MLEIDIIFYIHGCRSSLADLHCLPIAQNLNSSFDQNNYCQVGFTWIFSMLHCGSFISDVRVGFWSLLLCTRPTYVMYLSKWENEASLVLFAINCKCCYFFETHGQFFWCFKCIKKCEMLNSWSYYQFSSSQHFEMLSLIVTTNSSLLAWSVLSQILRRCMAIVFWVFIITTICLWTTQFVAKFWWNRQLHLILLYFSMSRLLSFLPYGFLSLIDKVLSSPVQPFSLQYSISNADGSRPNIAYCCTQLATTMALVTR